MQLASLLWELTCHIRSHSVTGHLPKVTLPPLGKHKVFPYLFPSVGPGADPGVQAVSPAVGCHYFLPGLLLPS